MMKRNLITFKVCVLVSFLIHFLMACQLISNPQVLASPKEKFMEIEMVPEPEVKETLKKNNKNNAFKQEIISKPPEANEKPLEKKKKVPKKTTFVKKEDSDSLVLAQENEEAIPEKDCTNFYGGIGVNLKMDEYGQSIVDNVYTDYPAYKSDIQIGDRLNIPVSQIRGTIGTSVTLTVTNDTGTRTLTLIRAKICTKDSANRNIAPSR